METGTFKICSCSLPYEQCCGAKQPATGYLWDWFIPSAGTSTTWDWNFPAEAPAKRRRRYSRGLSVRQRRY